MKNLSESERTLVHVLLLFLLRKFSPFPSSVLKCADSAANQHKTAGAERFEQ